MPEPPAFEITIRIKVSQSDSVLRIFAALFTHQMKKNKENKVEINKMDLP